MTPRLPGRFGAVTGAIFLISALRLPGTFLYPAFWAEDGVIFFKDSVEIGTPALWKPVVGMYLTLSRTVAWLATFLPVRHTPLVYAVAAGLVASACLATFSRSGFRWLVPSDLGRVGLCLLFSLVPGAAECFFAIVPLTYLLFIAVFLLLLERDEQGGWVMGARRAMFLSFLWFSVGQAAILAPLVLYLLWRTRNRWYGLILATLVLSAVLNLASGNPHGPASPPAPRELLQVFGDNVLVRLFYLPALGREHLAWILGLSPGAFLGLSLAALLPVAWFALKTTRIDAEGWRVLGVAVLCGMTAFPVTAITRSYGLGVLLRPNLVFSVRYDVFPTIVALILVSAVLAPFFTGRRWLAAGAIFTLAAIHLLHEPIYRPAIPFRPFVWEWPRQAERIESALARRRAGQLDRPVVVREIGCRPGPPWGSLRELIISP